MTMMTDRNPQGRDTDAGFVDAVEDRPVSEWLAEILRELKLLRQSLALRGVAEDFGDLHDLWI